MLLLMLLIPIVMSIATTASTMIIILVRERPVMTLPAISRRIDFGLVRRCGRFVGGLFRVHIIGASGAQLTQQLFDPVFGRLHELAFLGQLLLGTLGGLLGIADVGLSGLNGAGEGFELDEWIMQLSETSNHVHVIE